MSDNASRVVERLAVTMFEMMRDDGQDERDMLATLAGLTHVILERLPQGEQRDALEDYVAALMEWSGMEFGRRPRP